MELSHFNYNLSLAETEIASTGIDKQIKFAENGGVGHDRNSAQSLSPKFRGGDGPRADGRQGEL